MREKMNTSESESERDRVNKNIAKIKKRARLVENFPNETIELHRVIQSTGSSVSKFSSNFSRQRERSI